MSQIRIRIFWGLHSVWHGTKTRLDISVSCKFSALSESQGVLDTKTNIIVSSWTQVGFNVRYWLQLVQISSQKIVQQGTDYSRSLF